MRPSYSPLTIVTWFAAAAVTVLLFGIAIANCAHTVQLNDTIDINEGEPFPLTGHRFVRVHLDLGGAPGDRCDSMNGSYEPQSRTCLVLLFP